MVAAQGGERARYVPIRSPLCQSSDPEQVLEALLTLAPFSTVYLADLDAIRGLGDQFEVIARLIARYHRIQFWIDAGVSSYDGLIHWERCGNIVPVIGSESQASLVAARSLINLARAPVLSLDFSQGQFLGPRKLLDQTSAWPHRVIAMSLHRIGSGDGPDFARLEDLQRAAPARQIFAAGGIRDHVDLLALKRQGVPGALCATALHQKTIGAVQLRALSEEKPLSARAPA